MHGTPRWNRRHQPLGDVHRSQPSYEQPHGWPDATDAAAAQSLLEQLPIRTSLESVSNDASGDLLIEEREDGTVWLSLSGLSLTGAVEPRVLLTSAPLEDNDGGLRFPSDVGSQVGSLTSAADQELQIIDPETIGASRAS